jgi:spermidine/putrescine ABC transporter ATP-binding subunit
MSLELRSISKAFGEVAAVSDVSLSVKGGEFFSLLGPSGCGKTTLLRTIAGIYQPDTGTITLNGRAIGTEPMNRRNTALVFQNYALFPHLSVHDNIAFGLTMRKERKSQIGAKVDSVLDLVRLPGYQKRYPRELSGGQQQRVALARALVIEPELLLLDEPLSNLDAKLRETMRHEIREIQQRIGITTILVTHDLHEAFAMSDRIAVMNAGRIEQVGTPRDIYSRPHTRFTAEFAGPTNTVTMRVVENRDGVVKAVTPEGMELKASGLDGVRPDGEVAVILRPERIRVDAQPSGLANSFPATVTKTSYLGSTIIYVVDINGLALTAQCNNTDDFAFKEGDSVIVGWSEHDVIPHH